MSLSRQILMLVLAVAMCAAPVTARSPKRAPIRAFAITDFDGELYAEGEIRTNEQTTETATGETTIEEEEWLFEEGIELSTEGYFYHPNFVDWRLGFRLAATQEEVRIDEEEFKTRGTLKGYDVSTTFLKEKPLSLRLFASKTDSLRDRDFERSIDAIEKRRGGELLLKGPFPASLLMEKLNTIEESEVRFVDETSRHLRFSIEDRRSRDWLTEFTYDHEESERLTVSSPMTRAETYQTFLDTTDEVNVTNLWQFGTPRLRDKAKDKRKTKARDEVEDEEPEKHSLDGQFRWLRRVGFFENLLMTADQRLELNHTKTFTTFYSGSYNLDRTEDETEEIFTGEIGFIKKFYESLDVTGRLTAEKPTVNNGFEKTLGAFLEVDYRKKTPLGRYTTSVLWGREREHQLFEGGDQIIRGESVTLNGFVFSELAQSPVIPGSITVTDLTRTVTYSPITDYAVQTVGQTTSIARIGGTTIANGETVLVDYATEEATESRYHTNYFTWNNRFEIKKLPVAVYANYRLRDEVLDWGEELGNLDRDRNFLMGAELDYKGLRITLEHEIQDQLLSPPWDADRIGVEFRKTLSRNLEFSIGGDAEEVRYRKAVRFGLEPGADSLKTLSGRASLTTKLGKNALLRLSSDLSKTTGRENRTEMRSGVSLEWEYAKLEFSIDGSYDIYTEENLSGSTSTSGKEAVLMFKIRRRF